MIDEAQDFAMGSDWIELIEGMLIDDDNKRFILFHDDNQQIYSENKLILNDFIPYPLDTNIRNIHNYKLNKLISSINTKVIENVFDFSGLLIDDEEL